MELTLVQKFAHGVAQSVEQLSPSGGLNSVGTWAVAPLAQRTAQTSPAVVVVVDVVVVVVVVVVAQVLGAGHKQLPFLQVNAPLQALPLQQISPESPQARQLPFLQINPLLQTLPLQQISPPPPQAWQAPFLQVSSDAQQVPLHSGVAQIQVPVLPQIRPSQQGEVALHVAPEAPQGGQQNGCPSAVAQQGWSLAQQVIPPGLLQPCCVEPQQTKLLQDNPEQQSESALHAAPEAPQAGTHLAGKVLKSQVSPGAQQRGQPVP